MGLRFYYFNSTHWDREWYLPMENFRRYLVDTADGILKALEEGKIEKYTFDGQTIVLEDVTEIRPDWRERLEKFIASGKLNVGPWYVMPDEYLVSGESLVHNLLIGRELSLEYGHEPWSAGYICDIFGHIAQMPQIFAGFGIKPAVVWRGVPFDAPAFFHWQGPDGTVCPTVRLPGENGYGSFAIKVTGWWDVPQDEETFKKNFTNFVETMRGRYGDHLVLPDGLDHMQVHSSLAQYFQWMRECFPDSELIHSDYRECLREFTGDEKTISGELLSTCRRPEDSPPMIPHTLSSRYDVKRGNDVCTNMMEYTTDPILAAMALAGNDEMLHFGKYAWKQLIKNHPHDSICGCSVDAVHRQILTRFEAVEQVLSEIVRQHRQDDLEALTGSTIYDLIPNCIDNRPESDIDKDGEYTVRVYNPLPWPRRETVQLDVPIPTAAPYPKYWAEPFGYESIPSFRLYTDDGREIPYQRGRLRKNYPVRLYRSFVRLKDVVPVTAEVEMPACGWTSIHLRVSQTPPRFLVSNLTGHRKAENPFIKLEVENDGSLKITDKRTGKVFSRCNSFLIDREIGDGWNHVRPAGSAEYLQPMTARSVSVRADGPCRTTFEIITDVKVPAELEFQGNVLEHYDGIAESRTSATLTVKSLVSLNASSPEVEIVTSIDNNIKDYRLRMVIPTGIPGKYFAGQNYAFVEREAGRALGRATEDYLEAEPIEKNFTGIVGKRDAHGGMAFVAKYGLHEVGSSEFSSGDLYITLLRAFRRTVATNGEIDGQQLGHLTFEYVLKPLTPSDDNAVLRKYMCEYRSSLPNYILPGDRRSGDTPPIQLEGDLSFCALKPLQNCETGKAILRLVNHKELNAFSTVRLARPAKVVEVRLDEQDMEVVGEKVTEFKISAKPFQIRSFRVEFQN